jgi:preprotein translocase subunit SecY
MQVLTKAVPQLETLNKEGEQGRRKINQYMRVLTFPLAVVQSIGMIFLVKQAAQSLGGLGDITANAGMARWAVMVAALTGGAMVLMWLGELITEQSLGQGISLIITIGIVSRLPSFIGQIATATHWDGTTATDKLTMFHHNYSRHGLRIAGILVAGTIFVTWAVVKLNEASRLIPIQYAKRVQGNRAYGGVTSTLPVKLIIAGVIPVIFAVSILTVPGYVGQILAHGATSTLAATTHWQRVGVDLLTYFQNPSAATFAAGGWQPWVYPVTYFLLVFVFTYFYTNVQFNSKEIAENLQKQGAFISGVRSGKQTEKYLRKIVNRLNLFGGIALAALALLPIVAQVYINQSIAIGGTSILILVSVALQTLRQVESRALMITYDRYESPDYFDGNAIQPGRAGLRSKIKLPNLPKFRR